MAIYPYGFDNCAACGETWPQGAGVCPNCQALPGESDVDRSLRLAAAEAETDARETALDFASEVAQATLEGLSDVYQGALGAYRQGIIDVLCRFTQQFVPGAYAVKLGADIDWRWCFDAFVDVDGNEIDAPLPEDFYVSDVLEPGYLSNLTDFYKASYGYVYVADKVFCDEAPTDYTARKLREQRA